MLISLPALNENNQRSVFGALAHFRVNSTGTKAARSLGVEPIEVGRVIVATWIPHQNAVLQAIQETGLELLIVFNKNAVMVLPTGINKATGLNVALRRFGLSFHEAVGIGDGENDQSFLDRCECSVAVANAVPSILKLVDLITKREAGGVWQS